MKPEQPEGQSLENPNTLEALARLDALETRLHTELQEIGAIKKLLSGGSPAISSSSGASIMVEQEATKAAVQESLVKSRLPDSIGKDLFEFLKLKTFDPDLIKREPKQYNINGATMTLSAPFPDMPVILIHGGEEVFICPIPNMKLGRGRMFFNEQGDGIAVRDLLKPSKINQKNYEEYIREPIKNGGSPELAFVNACQDKGIVTLYKGY